VYQGHMSLHIRGWSDFNWKASLLLLVSTLDCLLALMFLSHLSDMRYWLIPYN